MYTHRRLAALFALAFAASSVSPAQSPVILNSPDAALELSIAVLDTRTVDGSTTLKLKLAPGGGAAIRMLPAD